jgi:beta-galactosidase beta subunit
MKFGQPFRQVKVHPGSITICVPSRVHQPHAAGAEHQDA